MSLILEALKKSEAKRRLGEAPDLGTPFAGTVPRRGPLPFILAAIVIVAGVGWWLLRTPATTDKPATTPVAAQPQARARTAPAVKPPAAAAPAAVATENTRPPTPVTPVTGADVAAADRPAANPIAAPAISNKPDPFVAGPSHDRPMPGFGNKKSMPRPAEARMAGQKTLPPPTAPAPIAPKTAVTSDAKAPVASTAYSKPATTPTEAPVAGQKALPPPAAASESTAATTAGAQKTPATVAKAAAADQPPAAAGAQPYYELPFSVRKDLPALRLNMHVYAPDPTQRFVILNNSRMAEGDSQDDLALREIRPDGVVLEFKGQRFFYPRDGL